MLSEQRIKEAASNVKAYLEDGLLVKKNKVEPIVLNVLANNAEESLKVAKILHEGNHSSLWVIVTSYYSMFYMANAVLYTFGYKVADKIPHKVTADALIIFIRSKLKTSLLEEYENMRDTALAGIKADELVETFDRERNKRSLFQYNTNEQAKQSKATTSLERAKEFKFEMEKLLD